MFRFFLAYNTPWPPMCVILILGDYIILTLERIESNQPYYKTLARNTAVFNVPQDLHRFLIESVFSRLFVNYLLGVYPSLKLWN